MKDMTAHIGSKAKKYLPLFCQQKNEHYQFRGTARLTAKLFGFCFRTLCGLPHCISICWSQLRERRTQLKINDLSMVA